MFSTISEISQMLGLCRNCQIGPRYAVLVAACVITARGWSEETDPARMNFRPEAVRVNQLQELRRDGTVPAADYPKWLNMHIPDAAGQLTAREWLARHPANRQQVVHLVADAKFLNQLADRVPPRWVVHQPADVGEKLIAALGSGDTLVWIGSAAKLPDALPVRAFQPTEQAAATGVAPGAPLALDWLQTRPTRLQSAFIRPRSDPRWPYYPRHNIDEEIRADVLPLLVARDRYGREIGYPAVLVSNYAPSLAQGRFAGSDWFFFLLEDPSAAMSRDHWGQLLDLIEARFRSGLQIRQFEVDFATYRAGERVRARTRVFNALPHARALEVEYQVKKPDEGEFHSLRTLRRVAERASETEATIDFVAAGQEGLWQLRTIVRQDPQVASLPGMRGQPATVELRDAAFVVLEGSLHTPSIVQIDGPGILLNGQNDFLAGTTYYPSSSWWEWLWRDFHPELADQAFAAMRRCGYRLVRIWLDPSQEEQTLRAADAMIWLAARHGIVLDVCVFTQWVRTMGYDRADGSYQQFDFRPLSDFNMYGVSLRNLDHQRAIMHNYAARWKAVGNIVYDLSNEVYLHNPDPSQMDDEARKWDAALRLPDGPARDSALFARWSDMLTGVIRHAGGKQPVIPGYMFDFSRNYGGDTYQGNLRGDLVPWHDYGSPAIKGDRLPNVDPISSNRPLVLEEFGGIEHTGDAYDSSSRYALAAGAAACMAYEWGISWLARESCYTSLELSEIAIRPDGSYDPRFFTEVIGDVANHWNPLMVGTAPWSSGYWNSSIYDGTPFPMAAAAQLGRMGLMGKGLGRIQQDYAVYVVVPTTGVRSFDKRAEVFHTLRQQKIPLGIWQECDLSRLPQSARLVIWTDDDTRDEATVRALQARQVQVITTMEESVADDPQVPRLATTAADDLELFTRATPGGTLYCLLGSGKLRPAVKLATESHQITAGWRDCVMARVNASGVNLIEGSESIAVDGHPFCSLDAGRVIVGSLDDQPLLDCHAARLSVSEPGALRFSRPLASAEVIDGTGRRSPVGPAALDIDRRVLRIDDQAQHYAIEVVFAAPAK